MVQQLVHWPADVRSQQISGLLPHLEENLLSSSLLGGVFGTFRGLGRKQKPSFLPRQPWSCSLAVGEARLDIGRRRPRGWESAHLLSGLASRGLQPCPCPCRPTLPPHLRLLQQADRMGALGRILDEPLLQHSSFFQFPIETQAKIAHD